MPSHYNRGCVAILPDCRTIHESRPPTFREPAQTYAQVRAHTEMLARPLSAEDCPFQSMPDASPVKWHLAHTSWFFESVILARRSGYRPFDPRFAYLFNSYYEAPWAAPSPAPPRPAYPARPGRGEGLSRPCRCGVMEALSRRDPGRR